MGYNAIRLPMRYLYERQHRQNFVDLTFNNIVLVILSGESRCKFLANTGHIVFGWKLRISAFPHQPVYQFIAPLITVN